MKKKMLVTGGAGFIGSHLCEELLSRGFIVSVVDDFSTARRSNLSALKNNKNIKLYRGSILDERLLKRLIKDCDIVYHLAAAVGVKYILDNPVCSILTNIEGTQVVLKFADKYRKKVVIASTSEVYGKHVCSPISEEDDRVLGSTNISRWSYSDAKAIDEFLALAYSKERKLRVVIVRYFNTVGPRQTGRYGMVLPRFVEEALSGRPITVYGDGSQIRSFTHVKDAVRATVDLSLNKPAEGQIFNIGNDKPITIKDLAVKIKQETSSRSEIVYVPYQEAYGEKFSDFEEISCRIPNISKIKKVVNFQPQFGIDNIIEDTVDYFLKNKKTG